MLDFGTWLHRQTDREGLVGDLARHVADDEDLAAVALTPSRLRDHVEACGGNELALRACALAASTYKLEAPREDSQTGRMRPLTGLQYRDHAKEKQA